VQRESAINFESTCIHWQVEGSERLPSPWGRSTLPVPYICMDSEESGMLSRLTILSRLSYQVQLKGNSFKLVDHDLWLVAIQVQWARESTYSLLPLVFKFGVFRRPLPRLQVWQLVTQSLIQYSWGSSTVTRTARRTLLSSSFWFGIFGMRPSSLRHNFSCMEGTRQSDQHVLW
jgi:hypothetical protein